jgi:hypothetical protein
MQERLRNLGRDLSANSRILLAASLLAGMLTLVGLRVFPSLMETPRAREAMFRFATLSIWVSQLYLGTVVLLHGAFAPLIESWLWPKR